MTKKTAEKPLTADERHQAIAEVNARHQAGELDAAAAQAEIDALRGVRRVVDEQTGQTSVVDASTAEQADSTGQTSTAARSGKSRTSSSASTPGE